MKKPSRILQVLGAMAVFGLILFVLRTPQDTIDALATPAPVDATQSTPEPQPGEESLNANPQANNDAPVQPPANWRELQEAAWEGKTVPQLSSSDFGRGSAQRVVAQFVRAWQDKNYQGMSEVAQVSWLAKQAQPAQLLEAWFGMTRVRGAKIIRTEQSGETGRRVTVELFCNVPQGEPTVETREFMVICETPDGIPSRSGKWGINPASVLRRVDAHPL